MSRLNYWRIWIFMFGFHNRIMHKTTHSKRRHSWWLLGSISVVLASDVPPATLPKGFLEQLPLLESFNAQEFESFLHFTQQQIKQPQKLSKPKPTDSDNSTENTTKKEIYNVLPMDDPLSKRVHKHHIKEV